MEILIFAILLPLLALVALKWTSNFPARMAALIFFVVPFAGSAAMVTGAELSKPHPHVSIIPVAAVFFYFYGLFFFGLWSVVSGVMEWLLLKKIELYRRLNFGGRIGLSVCLGALAGAFIVFGLYWLYSLTPGWPVEHFQQVIHEMVSILVLTAMGLAGGAVCGLLVGLYPGVRATPEPSA